MIRNRYAARMNTVHEQLDTYTDFAPFMEAPRTGGEHTVLPLAGDMPLRVLLSRLQKRGVIVDTTERYYPEGTYQVHEDQMLRLNISNVPKQRIEEGMQVIREEILKLQIRQK